MDFFNENKKRIGWSVFVLFLFITTVWLWNDSTSNPTSFKPKINQNKATEIGHSTKSNPHTISQIAKKRKLKSYSFDIKKKEKTLDEKKESTKKESEKKVRKGKKLKKVAKKKGEKKLNAQTIKKNEDNENDDSLNNAEEELSPYSGAPSWHNQALQNDPKSFSEWKQLIENNLTADVVNKMIQQHREGKLNDADYYSLIWILLSGDGNSFNYGLQALEAEKSFSNFIMLSDVYDYFDDANRKGPTQNALEKYTLPKNSHILSKVLKNYNHTTATYFAILIIQKQALTQAPSKNSGKSGLLANRNQIIDYQNEQKQAYSHKQNSMNLSQFIPDLTQIRNSGNHELANLAAEALEDIGQI